MLKDLASNLNLKRSAVRNDLALTVGNTLQIYPPWETLRLPTSDRPVVIHPEPYTQTLNPTPDTLDRHRCNLHPTPWTGTDVNPTPDTLNLTPNPTPWTGTDGLRTRNDNGPETLIPKP